MQTSGPRGPYYRLLAQVARLVQSEAIGAHRRFQALVALTTGLLGLAWILANALVVQAGEIPGTAAYDRLLFSYLMRLVCGEALVVGGVLLSALWAQQAGRIPHYEAPADERD